MDVTPAKSQKKYLVTLPHQLKTWVLLQPQLAILVYKCLFTLSIYIIVNLCRRTSSWLTPVIMRLNCLLVSTGHVAFCLCHLSFHSFLFDNFLISSSSSSSSPPPLPPPPPPLATTTASSSPVNISGNTPSQSDDIFIYKIFCEKDFSHGHVRMKGFSEKPKCKLGNNILVSEVWIAVRITHLITLLLRCLVAHSRSICLVYTVLSVWCVEYAMCVVCDVWSVWFVGVWCVECVMCGVCTMHPRLSEPLWSGGCAEVFG